MTIKNLITYFRQFTTQHPILKTFSWGNLSDYSREDYITEYPAIHFVPQPSTLGNTSQDITFSLLIYDLLNEYVDNPINSNQLDSMALCEEIMGDFYNFFVNQLTDYGYFLNMPVSYTYFTDRFGESVCGVEANITITIDQTACIPPFIVPSPTPSPTPTITPTPIPVTPSITPTLTPTITPSPTSSPLPVSPTPTPTLTPTPSSTPPVPVFEVGSGFDVAPSTIYTDGLDKYIAGVFNFFNGQPVNRIIRVDDFGNIDPTFTATTDGNIQTICDGGDGYLYIGGAFTKINGVVKFRIAKISKTNGSLDTSFTGNSNNVVNTILSDGSDIIVGGTFITMNSVSRGRIAKLSKSTGTLDTSAFSGTSFNSSVLRVIKNLSGNYVVSNMATQFNSVSCSRIIEIDSSTYLDTTLFGTTYQPPDMRSIFQHSTTGDYYWCSLNGILNGTTANGKIHRATSGGTYVNSAAVGGVPMNAITLDDVNDYVYINYIQSPYYLRYDTSLVRDTTWDTNVATILAVGMTNQLPFISIDSNNKIFVIGSFTGWNSLNFNHIVRLNQDGTLDSTN